MNGSIRIMIGAAALGALAGCVETGGSGGTSGGVVAPAGMVDECIRQVRVGRPDASITTRDPILAGPGNRVFVGMTVDGMSWGCRIEDDGSYTAFPTFAN
ncbi:hypothetical protein SAMN05444722_2151 [Rhodovulum sp. ES.010]|uniref:hypothetical protein n=1 Tax=Rhodovulum sp. ES.010 TaxID=1882821 RepID=UPI000926862F|nr:hypothetical protein [Rhodovulum sp. ES.010]SIO43827.1 hypothetical protein SAMN05444722_2151 [Rhodovulum sp. ES.010]